MLQTRPNETDTPTGVQIRHWLDVACFGTQSTGCKADRRAGRMSYNMAYDNKGFSPGNDRFNNYPGRGIAQRRAHRRLGRASRILVPLSVMCIELFERMTYFTITAGIMYYVVKNLTYNIHDGGLMTLVLFSGGAYLAAPFGGLVADAFLGRFTTILSSTIVYIAGLAVLVTGSYDTSEINIEAFDL
ncbi:solute carrier family 15 member 4-like, partial [Elysia marginata]